MSEKTPVDPAAAGGARAGGAQAHRGAVTAGTAPAFGRGRAASSSQGAEDARRAARAVDRRGALLGLLTAGVAVVVGAAVGGRDGAGSGTGPVSATGDTV